MFSKVSFKGFVYDLIDIFMFPTPTILKIYHKYDVDHCYLYQNLTDTDSTSMFFVFLCNLNSCLSGDKGRNIIFEVMLESQVFDRFDLLAQFYEQFDCRNEDLKKELDYLKSKILITLTY